MIRDKYIQVESDKKDNYTTLEVSTNPKGPTGIRYPSNIASDIINRHSYPYQIQSLLLETPRIQ